MSKSNRQREIIFDTYSKNLSWMKEHPGITFSPEFRKGYICPLCFDPFTKEDLNQFSINPLTFDHNPPASLGGKSGLLTCKQCNSRSGHVLDIQLLKRLEEIDFLEFAPNSSRRTTLNNAGNKVTSTIPICEDQSWKIQIERKHSNPVFADGFFSNYTLTEYNPLLDWNSLEPRIEKRIDFEMDLSDKTNKRYAEVALLKIAYLIAIEKFGNGFYANFNLYKVREQILNPDKIILPGVFGIAHSFPQKALGLNIINKPSALHTFLIIFELTTKSRKRQFSIALPGFGSNALQIYENLERVICDTKDTVNINLVHLADKNYVREKHLTFASSQYWKNIILSTK